MIVNEGFVFIYRLFDIAEEINLEHIIGNLNASSRFKLTSNKSIFIKENPISFSFGNEVLELGTQSFECEKLCKVWHYGVLSVCLKINIKDMEFKKLQDLSNLIESSTFVNKISIETKDSVKKKIKESLKQPAEYDLIEDYTTFVITKISKENIVIDDPNIIKNELDLASIILAENKLILAEKNKNSIIENYLQYSTQDMTIIDWNSAIILDLATTHDYIAYTDLLEFSLSHLLELRVYDAILDDRLNSLYDSMDKELAPTMDYSGLSKEASQIYIEISEILERVNNSIKAIGDSYYTTIIRYINKKFRIEDWEKSTSQKLDKLMNISTLLQDRVESKISDKNEKISHFYEKIVIILIVIEIVNSLWDKFDFKLLIP